VNKLLNIITFVLMNLIEKHITELLYRYECVILPQFGALLSSYKSAYYNTSNDIFYPPSKQLAFNAVLQSNDWLLAGYLSEQENTSKEEALEKVEAYIAGVKRTIESTNSFVIDEVGVFSLNQEGETVFTPQVGQNYLNDSFGLLPIRVDKVVETSKRVKGSTKRPSKEKIVQENLINSKLTQRIMAENKMQEEDKQKRSSFFLIAPIVLLLLAGGAFSWFMADKEGFKQVASFGFLKSNTHNVSEELASEEESQGEYLSEQEEHVSLEENTENEESSEDLATNHDEETSVEEIVVATIEDNGDYHVIAGAFGVEENAINFSAKTEGSKIIEGRRYHMVSVGSYSSREEAESAISSLENQYGSGLWVHQK